MGTPISGLAVLTTGASGDLVEIIDISDTSMSPNGTNKKMSLLNLLKRVFGDLQVDGTVKAPAIVRGIATDLLQIGGGAVTDSSANIVLYGVSHPTLANVMYFRRGSVIDGARLGDGRWQFNGAVTVNSDTDVVQMSLDRATAVASNRIITFASNVGGTDTTNCYIEADGDVYNTNGTYGTISDLKLKQNITDATDKLLDLLNVRIVNYELKREPGKKLLGVIAQELEEILPGLIKESDDYAMLPDPDYILKPERTEWKQVTEIKPVEKTVVVFEDGKYVEKIEIEEKEIPVMEEVSIYDESGKIIRKELRPKMEAVTIPAETEKDRPLKSQKTGETTKTVKMSVFIPIIIKALQELNAKVEAK